MQTFSTAGPAAHRLTVDKGRFFQQGKPPLLGAVCFFQPATITPPNVLSVTGQKLIWVSQRTRELVARGVDERDITEALYAEAERRSDAALRDLLDSGVCDAVINRTLSNMEGARL